MRWFRSARAALAHSEQACEPSSARRSDARCVTEPARVTAYVCSVTYGDRVEGPVFCTVWKRTRWTSWNASPRVNAMPTTPPEYTNAIQIARFAPNTGTRGDEGERVITHPEERDYDTAR
jgi:hypothetical protein